MPRQLQLGLPVLAAMAAAAVQTWKVMCCYCVCLLLCVFVVMCPEALLADGHCAQVELIWWG
jgi:hypothetical protein